MKSQITSSLPVLKNEYLENKTRYWETACKPLGLFSSDISLRLIVDE